MITAKNITKQFGKLKALDNVSVTFSKGECIALLGPNGSGKTTLIKSLLGMVVPDSGSIHFDNKDFQSMAISGTNRLYAANWPLS